MTVLETLRLRRHLYPTPMSNDQIGELLNGVAWTHRAQGLGLFAKPTGAHCRQPRTGLFISRDYLVYHDGRGFDMLRDSEGAGVPQQGSVHTMNVKRWLPPVDADLELPQTPDPLAVTGPIRVYPGDHVGVAIGDALFADYAAAGQAPNAGMGTWFLRVCWDVTNPPYLPLAQAIAKHQKAWLQVLKGER